MRRLAATGWLCALSACGVEKTVSSVVHTTVMVSTLVASPPLAIPGTTLPVQVGANVYLGERNFDPTKPPSGYDDAQVRVEHNGQVITFHSAGDGSYQSDDEIEYVAGDTYRFVAERDGHTFAEQIDAPSPEVIPEFHDNLAAIPSGGLPNVDANLTGLSFLPIQPDVDEVLHRSSPSDQRGLAWVAVVPINNTSVGAPVYSDPTDNTKGITDLFLNPKNYQTDTVTVPGTQAWSSCPQEGEVLSLTAFHQGSVEGDNLSLGSAVLAGQADAVLVLCPLSMPLP
jgi:hypothetical protein